MEERQRHCWECRRRCLVCDFTQPECKRCSAAGTPCPGYGDKPPLRLNWLAPGKVKSRTRKPKGAEKKDWSLAVNDRSKNPEYFIISRWRLKINEDALLDAVAYYNTAMYPNLSRTRIGNHPGVYRLEPRHAQIGISRPEFLRLGIVCMTLNHRMNSTQDPSYARSLAPTYFHFRGMVLRSLNEAMRMERYRDENVTFLITGILSLLLADAHQGASPHWRFHLEGIQKLISLRGGLRTMTEPGIKQVLFCYAYVTVLGDTSSPANNLSMSTGLLEELDIILNDHDDNVYSFYPLPKPIFAAIVKINYLRARAAAFLPLLTPTDDMAQEAAQLLTTIQSFHPESWAQSHTSSELWLLLGQMMKAAATVYCISSLQSISVLSETPGLLFTRATYRQHLFRLLKTVLATSHFGASVLWPLVVLGVDAINDTVAMRDFVSESLGPLSQSEGSYVPLTARDMLERYWASGKTSWDGCFDRPYALAMQLMVNRQGLKETSMLRRLE